MITPPGAADGMDSLVNEDSDAVDSGSDDD